MFKNKFFERTHNGIKCLRCATTVGVWSDDTVRKIKTEHMLMHLLEEVDSLIVSRNYNRDV